MQLRRTILEQIETIDDALELKSPVRYPQGCFVSTPRRRTAQAPLRSVLAEVIKQKPMDRHEILQAVQASGYQFSTDNPLNSSAALYSNKKIFRQENKKFYLVAGYETEIVPKKRGRKPKKVSSSAA